LGFIRKMQGLGVTSLSLLVGKNVEFQKLDLNLSVVK
jgi:hypothetical protein